jgi:hypothetical protein
VGNEELTARGQTEGCRISVDGLQGATPSRGHPWWARGDAGALVRKNYVPSSRHLLLKPVLMVQATQDRAGHHTQMLGKVVSMPL